MLPVGSRRSGLPGCTGSRLFRVPGTGFYQVQKCQEELVPGKKFIKGVNPSWQAEVYI